MKVTVHTDALAIIEATPTGITKLTFTENPVEDDAFFTVEMPGSSPDDPPISGTRDEVAAEIDDLVERKKFGEQVLARFTEITEMIVNQPIPEVEVGGQQLADEAARRRNSRRTWLIEQVEQGSFAAIELLKQEFGEEVKIHVEVTSEAA